MVFRIVTATFVGVALAACGDASINTAGQWHGVGTGPGGDTPTSTAPTSTSGTDASAPPQDSGGSQSASFNVMLGSTSADVELRNSAQPVVVTIAPNNFSGAVNLTVTGLPAGVTGTFDNATVNVSGNTGASAQLTFTTKSDTPVGPINAQIVATSGSATQSSPITVNVKPVLTITIPMNVDAMKGTNGNPSKTVFGTFPIVITAPANIATNPIQVKVLNADSAGHCVHASNPNQGFPHDPVTNGVCNALIQKGQFDAQNRAITATGTYTFYLHDQGDLTEGQIKIQ
jgi:hypothetical protein